MIRVSELHKNFGEIQAVNGVSFEAKPGAVFGLLGPNGAGKSTAINCISGLIKPTAGHISVNGFDILAEARKAKQSLGIVPQELAIYEDLSARDNLSYWGAAYGLSGEKLKTRVDHVLDKIGLTDRARDLPKKYSGGMKRRLNFGCGVVHEPRVLLLDEPTVGVDPQSRERLFDLVREERDKGTCVLYTTHYMEEAETLCNELAIIDHGKIIAAGTLKDLRAQVGESDIIQLSGVFSREKLKAALKRLKPAPEIISLSASTLVLAQKEAAKSLPQVLKAISGTGAEIRETRLSEPNLESLFIKLTGKDLRA